LDNKFDIFKEINKIFTSQIKKSSVKLPKKREVTPKIQDNNQSINNGVIHDTKSQSTL